MTDTTSIGRAAPHPGVAARAREFLGRAGARRPGELAGPWTKGYLYASLAFFSGALDRPLSGNPSSFVESTESPLIQIAGITIYLVALWLTLRGKVRFRPTLVNLSFVGLSVWAIASTVWSGEADVAFRRSVAYAGTMLFGFVAANVATPKELLRIAVRLALIMVLVSAVIAIISPTYAFHQASDLGVAEHAGRMRGSFSHKNEFARILALSVIVLLCFGRQFIREPLVWAGALLAAAPMMVLAGSAKILAAIPLAVGSAFLVRAPGRAMTRLGTIFLLILGGMLLYIFGDLDVLMGQVLSALGRDSELSGRDVIWEAAVRSISGHFIFGQGYFTGWRAQGMLDIEQLKGITLGHAHNGYLETTLDLGIVGLGLALMPLFYLLGKALTFSSRAPRRLHIFMTMWIVMVMFVNMSGSYLTNYNDLFTVFMILIYTWVLRVQRGELDPVSYALFSR